MLEINNNCTKIETFQKFLVCLLTTNFLLKYCSFMIVYQAIILYKRFNVFIAPGNSSEVIQGMYFSHITVFCKNYILIMCVMNTQEKLIFLLYLESKAITNKTLRVIVARFSDMPIYLHRMAISKRELTI